MANDLERLRIDISRYEDRCAKVEKELKTSLTLGLREKLENQLNLLLENLVELRKEKNLKEAQDPSLLEAFFPSTLYCITFTLYDGANVAMRLVSHAKANGFRGEVRHVSTSRSDFTLLITTEDEASRQTLKRFASWLATEVPVHAPAVETIPAFAKAAEAAAARVEVTSNPSNPLTSDRELLDMYMQGPLTVYADTEVRLALEKAAEAVEERERLSNSSLGRSRASSSHE